MVRPVPGAEQLLDADPQAVRGIGKTKSEYGGGLDGANLLDWPVRGARWAVLHQAETKSAPPTANGRAPLPANNNYIVFANGAERIGYHFYATGPYGTNAEPYDGRPASIQDGFNFQGDKNGVQVEHPGHARSRKALATGKLDLRPNCHAVQITHDAAGRADAVLYLDADGNLQRQRARVVCVAGNAIETPRLLLLSGRRRCSPTGWRTPPARWAATTCGTPPGRCTRSSSKPVHMHRGETMAGVIADESRHDPTRGFAGGYYLETLSLGAPFLAAFAEPGSWGPEFTSIMDAYANTAGLWIVGEDMPQETNRITLNARGHRPARAAGAERALRRPPQRRRHARPRLRRRAEQCTRPSARPARTARRPTRRPTTWARRG